MFFSHLVECECVEDTSILSIVLRLEAGCEIECPRC